MSRGGAAARGGSCRKHDRKKASRTARDPAWNPKSRYRVYPGELGPVTLIRAIATEALLKLRSPLRSHPAASRPALPACHVQVAAARSTGPAVPPRTRFPGCSMPAPLPQPPARRWICPPEAGAESAPPTPASCTYHADL